MRSNMILAAMAAGAFAASAQTETFDLGGFTLDPDDSTNLFLDLSQVVLPFTGYSVEIVFSSGTPSAVEVGDDFSIDVDAEFVQPAGAGLPNFLDLDNFSNFLPGEFVLDGDTLTVTADFADFSPSGFIPGTGFTGFDLSTGFDPAFYDQIEFTFGSTPIFAASASSVTVTLFSVPAPGAAAGLAAAGLVAARRRR